MFRGKGSESTIIFSVELNENVVPDFYDKRVILVDKMCSFSTTNVIVVNFTSITISAKRIRTSESSDSPARSTRPGSSHLYST